MAPAAGKRAAGAAPGRSLILVIAAAALGAKLLALAGLHGHPLLQPAFGLDSEAYFRLASRVAAGDLALGPDPYFVSPLYTYALGALLAASGSSLLFVKLAQVALGAAAVALVGFTARRWFGPRAGHAAAVAAALTGVFTFNEVLVLQSALDPFLTATVLFTLTIAVLDRRPWAWLGAGVALGLFALNRPNALLCVPVLAAACSWRPPRRRGALLVAGTLLALAPAALRNWVVAGEPLLVSSHGGLNLYIGNNPEADGTYHAVPGVRPNIEGQADDARRVAEHALGRPLGAAEVSRHFGARAGRWAAEDPGRAVALFLRKLAYTLNDADLALNYSYRYYAGEGPLALRALFVGPWLLVPLGVAGLVFGRRRPEGHGYLAWVLFPPAYALSVAVFFVSSRYRMPLLVSLCVGAGAAIDLLRLREGFRWKRAAVVAVPLAVLANWPLGLDEGVGNERAEMALHLVDVGREQEAVALVERAAARDAAPGLLYFRAGRAFLERGRAERAAELLAKAQDAFPRPETQLLLGQALLDLGRAREAIPHLEAARAAGARPELAGYDLARALATAGRREEARAALRAVPAPADPGSLLALGALALDLQDARLAVPWLEQAASAAPRRADIAERLGLALALAGRPRDAEQRLRAAARLDPGRASAWLNLAVVLAGEGRRAEAREAAEEALRRRPDYPQARGLLYELSRR